MSITDHGTRSATARPVRAFAALSAAAFGAMGALPPAWAGTPPEQGAAITIHTRYQSDPTAAPRHWPVGSPVRVERLNPALWVPGAARGFRMDYASTGHDGRERVVGGAVFVPPGTPPGGGWPIVSWAHGTVGVADACAPSTAPRSERDAAYLRRWLNAGYAIVATDYEGLGTRDEHPYLHGRSAAYNVIDMVRAARAVDGSLSRRWFAVGQSQGAQAVLYVAAVAHRYGAGLDFRGAIATAPPTQWRMTFAAVKPFRSDALANPLTPLVLSGADTATGGRIAVRDYLTQEGRRLYEATRSTLCLSGIVAHLAGKPVNTFFDVDAAEEERLIRVMVRYGEAPVRRYDAPVFIAQGGADQVVLPAATRRTAQALSAAGSDVTFVEFPSADHSGVMAAAYHQALAWTRMHLR